MNITNYYSCVVHLCMRQLFFWKSLTDTGKGVHLNVSSFQTVDKVPALPGFSIVYTVFLV